MPTFEHNDATIAYDLDGSGPPILHITGITDHHNSYGATRIRETLATRYTVLSFDNRGSGQTITNPGAPVTLDQIADDAAALIAHLDLGPVHVHGISMGGLIAKAFVLRHPGKARTLVSTVSSAGLNSPRSRHLLYTWRAMLDRDTPRDLINRFTASFLLGIEAFDYPRYIDAWISAPIDPLEQTRAGFDQQIKAVIDYDLRDRLREIRLPTLVTGSPSDVLAPFHFQQEVADGIPGTELKSYPGGHIFMTVPMFNRPYFEDLFSFWARHSV